LLDSFYVTLRNHFGFGLSVGHMNKPIIRPYNCGSEGRRIGRQPYMDRHGSYQSARVSKHASDNETEHHRQRDADDPTLHKVELFHAGNEAGGICGPDGVLSIRRMGVT
jgi:hypothetical protein